MNDQNKNAYAEEGDAAQTGVSRNTIYIAVAVVAAVVVIGILLALMFSGSDSDETVVVTTDPELVKVRPTEPATKPAEDENIGIYDRIETGSGSMTDTSPSETVDDMDVPSMLNTTGMTDKDPLDGYWQRTVTARGINPDGRFILQLASYLSYDDANNAWQRLYAVEPSKYADVQKVIERADLGRRGVFFRLRVGAFETKKSAEDYCDALGRDRKDCWITNR